MCKTLRALQMPTGNAVPCISLCRVTPVNQGSAKDVQLLAAVSSFTNYESGQKSSQCHENRGRLLTAVYFSASSKEAAEQNGSDLREPMLQKHTIVFGCPQLHWRGTEPVEAAMEVQGYVLLS